MAKSDTRELGSEGGVDATPAPGSAGVTPRRGHRVLAALLLVIGMLLTPITITALYVRTQLTDTGRYVGTVKPLAESPAVQAYVANSITNQLFDATDVTGYVKQVLPDRADPLAGPLTSALKNFTYEATLRVLQSDQFQTIWVRANELAHSSLMNVLTGKTDGVVQSTNGEVTVDLSAVGAAVKQQLANTGISAFSNIPTDKIAGRITIFQSEDLYKARHAFKVFNAAALVLPFIVVACFGGAILLSRNRRRGFIAAAVAFTLGAVIMAVSLAAGRGIYLHATTRSGIPHDAAANIYDTLIRMLQTSARAVLAFSIVVVIAAIFSGPSRLAVWFRSGVRRAVSWLGAEGDHTGWWVFRGNGFVHNHKAVIRIAVAIIGFVILVVWNRPTPLVILSIALAGLALLAIVEFYGRERDPSAGSQSIALAPHES